ncbi:MAG: aryl-sulfate sulfotransferase [Gemmatimonadota bacterium]
MRGLKPLLFFPPLLLALAGCGENLTTPAPPEPPETPPTVEPPEPPPPTVEEILVSEQVIPDTSGFAPLTATIDVRTEIPVSLAIRVLGLHGPESDVSHDFGELDTTHQIPVLGLYPDHENTVELTFTDDRGRELGIRPYTIQTPSLSSHMPSITIDLMSPEMAPGMTLVSYYGHNGDITPRRPFIFDRFGDIRWVLDYENHAELGDLAFEDGVERLANGNLYFADANGDRIYEVDMTGRIINTWDMPGFGFHHEVFEKPNGNFLVSVDNETISTVEDHVIEIQRSTGAIINVWDLRESLDQDRQTWSDRENDWVHVNAVTYDGRDDTIIVSGRHQGVVKLTADNEVVWILAPHRGWETAGDGTQLTQFLLQPLDAAGQPITDLPIVSGNANHPDFEWNWYQHAPLLTPAGNLMLFDNGDNRNYTFAERYSRAVEFDIDPQAMTVRQVWSYGKDRGAETFSRIVSDVDYLPEEDHVFFSPGAVVLGGNYGKVVEVDRGTEQVLFEATITPPQPIFIITFHRTERLSLYPEN